MNAQKFQKFLHRLKIFAVLRSQAMRIDKTLLDLVKLTLIFIIILGEFVLNKNMQSKDCQGHHEFSPNNGVNKPV